MFLGGGPSKGPEEANEGSDNILPSARPWWTIYNSAEHNWSEERSWAGSSPIFMTQEPWSSSPDLKSTIPLFQSLKPEQQRWLQILWERKLSRIIGRSSWSTRRLLTRYWFSDCSKMNPPKVDARLKDLRNQLKDLTTAYAKSEDDLKVILWNFNQRPKLFITWFQALQSVGQIVGEVLRQLTEEKFIVKVEVH